NQLQSLTNGSAVTTYGFDTRGNRASITPPLPALPTTLTYDQANRLTGYGATASYRFDGGGLRMSKTVSGTTTQFAWDAAEGLPMLLRESTATTTMNYITGPGGTVIESID